MPITNDDPLLHQEAQVTTVESGGFMVRQMSGFNGATPAQQIDTYCVSMDAVSALLTQIFTPPTPPPEA
jgi:hypothetical protein